MWRKEQNGVRNWPIGNRKNCTKTNNIVVVGIDYEDFETSPTFAH